VPGKSCFFVFNGDWVDRGLHQIELILSIFYSFILYPDRVFLNRGNHEDRAQNSQLTYKPCLKISCLRYFGKYGSLIYSKLDELFKNLPFATIVSNSSQKQRFFIVHGGINDELDLKKIQKLDRKLFTSICRPSSFDDDSLEKHCYKDVVDLLWSDPQTKSKGVAFNKTRNIGKLFGSNVTNKFLDENNFTNLIRSHECKSKGHDVVHDGKVITVFSASNYNLGNLGAVLKISSTKNKLDMFTYNSKNLPFQVNTADSKKQNNLEIAIRKLRKHLFTFKEKILEDCVKFDKAKDGFIKINELCFILDKYVANVPYKEIKDHLCECDDTLNAANYKTLFDNIHATSKFGPMPESITENFRLLNSIFHMIDVSGDGYISHEEFKKACTKIFNYLGTSYTEQEIQEFISAIDQNNDEKIDLQEFSNAFTVSITNL
jgi:serine/threonine-protein phosphatase with EF-hand domain